MATKSHFLLVALAFLAATNVIGGATALGGRKFLATEAPAPAPAADTDEAFVILDIKDPQVVDLAKFAVNEYNGQNNVKLIFDSIFAAAYTNDTKGVNYGLVILVNDGTGVNAYYNANFLVNKGANILVQLWKKNVE